MRAAVPRIHHLWTVGQHQGGNRARGEQPVVGGDEVAAGERGKGELHA